MGELILRVGAGSLRIEVPGSPGPAPTPTAIASVVVQNYGESPLVNPEVRFAHVFGVGEIPTGATVTLKVGDAEVPATFARRSTTHGDLRCVDILAKVPATIAAGESATVDLIATPDSAWDDGFPGAATVESVVADIVANHATISVVLEGLTDSAGSTEGSGNWEADSATAFGMTGTHGGYRCTATGPTAADFTVWMKLRDPNNANAEHDGLWARWYITAFLNTSTGAVSKLCWRAQVNQGRRDSSNDRYVGTVKLLLGSTVVRSWGYVADGRVLDFATTAVNATTDVITLPGHGFIHGELVRFTTTGSLPGGLATGTDYWAIPMSSSTLKLSSLQGRVITSQSFVNITSQGSGTHTIRGYVRSLRYQHLSLARPDGLWDWHSGLGEELGGEPTVYAIHDTEYYRVTRMAPPIDLATNMTSPTTVDPTVPFPVSYSPGTNGALQVDYNQTGGRYDYGSVWNEWACRAYRYRDARTTHVQTARVHAHCFGANPRHLVRDDATFRIPVLNGSTYSGLGTALPNTYIISMVSTTSSGNQSNDVILASGARDSYTNDDGSHHGQSVYPVYLFEGGQDLLDLIYSEANSYVAARIPSSIYFTLARNRTVSSTTYYTTIPTSQPRGDAWILNTLANAALVGADSDAETSYLRQVYQDTCDYCELVATDMSSASWRDAGVWSMGEQDKSGIGAPNASNTEGMSSFMQSHCALAFSFAAMRDPENAALASIVSHVAKYWSNRWIDASCKAFNTNYHPKTKTGPGTAYTDYSPWQDFGVQDSYTSGLAFAIDGTVSLASIGSAQIPLQIGDRVYLTDTTVESLTIGGSPAPPSPFQKYTWYYVRQPTGDGKSFKLSTTASDAGIVIPEATATGVNFWSDVQNRVTGCPLTIYRHNEGSIGGATGGYLTLERAAAAYLYLAGALPLEAFQTADAFFQLEDGVNLGPAGLVRVIYLSVETDF